MSLPVVVVSSPMNEVGVEILKRECEVREVHYGIASEAELVQALRDADAVITRSLPVTAALLSQCPRLKVVAKHGAGVDTIDVATATKLGIVVANSGDANSLGVAEHAVALMLATLRRIPEIHKMVAAGGGFAERERMVFGDLWEATVGLVGFGNIGRATGRMCRNGFQSKLIAYDPTVDKATMAAEGVEKADELQSLLTRADIISLHLPLNAQTHHLIGATQFETMKRNAIIINTARGGTIDEAALFDALQSGRIAGAGIDVFEQEPPGADNPLFQLKNVVLSPHIGGATLAARKRTATRAAQAALAVLAGRRPDYVINPEVLGQARMRLSA
ncbi:MAG: hydroxyacid dehydrogenase [Pseudomonadota bacterium]